MDGSYFKKIADETNAKKKIDRETMLRVKFESIISSMSTAANEGKYYVIVAVKYCDHEDFLELFSLQNSFKLYDTDWTEISEDNLYTYYQSPDHTIKLIISWQKECA